MLLLAALALIHTAARAEDPALLPGFQKHAAFAEQYRWTTHPSGIRVLLNAPLTRPGQARRLLVYATPNGNSIEQTLGSKPVAGRDWHFDIQHVAAQIRRFREIRPEESIALAVVEAPGRSWPAFRRATTDSEAVIQQIVAAACRDVAASRIDLAGHSGGGSFVFGYLEAAPTISPAVQRIILLDANYAYDDARHAGKLLAWLRGDSVRRLVVVAYDDRHVELAGKPVVSPTGGTYRATHRMIDRFATEISLSRDDAGSFLHWHGLAGQVEFWIHPNPENKILHTALVGDMNGLLHGLCVGSAEQAAWGRFGGPRAYSDWIDERPFSEVGVPITVESREPTPIPFAAPRLQLPPRPGDAPGGRQFATQIESLSRAEREAAILREIIGGNVPPSLRSLKAIALQAADSQGVVRRATIYVTPDYLAVGSDTDSFRLPMTPQTAQAIAAASAASLITARISDEVFRQAELKLPPRPLTANREQAATFYEHHQIIESQRGGAPPGLLVAGIKKDVVLTNRLRERPNRVAIYGWHTPDGKPIQPLYVGHVDWYVDYSHGIRLMSRQMLVDGRPMDAAIVLKDEELSPLLSSEGPIQATYVAGP